MPRATFDTLFNVRPLDKVAPMPGYNITETFEAHAEDYDFHSMEEVDAILDLPVGGSLCDGYATWTRVSE